MANSLVQFRIDDGLRRQANELCEKLGLDLSTYLRMSLTKLVQEQGVPFAVKLNTILPAENTIHRCEPSHRPATEEAVETGSDRSVRMKFSSDSGMSISNSPRFPDQKGKRG